MKIDDWLLEILACPACHAPLREDDPASELVCTNPECGLAYQVTAFPDHHGKDLAGLEAQANASARSLAAVYRRNPDWIYQGETVGAIVRDAEAMLHACGLTHAARTLVRRTR